jgi:hypothetical protein
MTIDPSGDSHDPTKNSEIASASFHHRESRRKVCRGSKKCQEKTCHDRAPKETCQGLARPRFAT